MDGRSVFHELPLPERRQGHRGGGRTPKFGEGYDFQGELSAQDVFWDAYSLNYRLWLFELEAGTAAPVRGLPDEDLPPSYSHAEIDGRFFLMREANDFTHTTSYELGVDGEATRRLQGPGTSYQWVKVR